MALPAFFQNAAAVTLSDSTDLSTLTGLSGSYPFLYIGGAGNLKVTTQGGQAVTFNGLTAGSVLYVRCKLAWATGSTATNVVALW